MTHHTFAFRLIMWYRILYGFFRVVLGLVLLKYIGQSFSAFFLKLMEHEIVRDKDDLLYYIFSPLAQHLHYNVSYFVAVYVIFWGVVDIFLSWQLLRYRLWAYPVTMVLLSGFTTYEIFRITHTHSLILGMVIVYDIFAIWLIWREYNKLEKHTLPKD